MKCASVRTAFGRPTNFVSPITMDVSLPVIEVLTWVDGLVMEYAEEQEEAAGKEGTK